MASGSSTASNSKLKDIGWDYGVRVESNNRDAVQCKFCDKVCNAGITRLKQHLMGGFSNVAACPKCPPNVKERLREALQKKLDVEKAKEQVGSFDVLVDLGDDDETHTGPRSVPGPKGPLDLFYSREPLKKKRKGGQDQVDVDKYRKELRDHAVQMFARWTDRNGRVLVNFLMNTPEGSVFLESVDASSYSKTGAKMCELISKYVDQIGPENVVQVVTDNASENVLAGKMLEVAYPHLYWTPCAAHCLDLMFEDIFKIPRFKKTVERAIRVNGCIYSRTRVLCMMRKFTDNKEMVRPAKTRFATGFLTLKRFQEEKRKLTRLFNSDEWHESKFSKEEVGKKIPKLLNDFFWKNTNDLLRIGGPLLTVLRMVDGEMRPAMGYIYEAMDKAKEAIATAFSNDNSKYKDIFQMIDKRWDNQLHKPLHAAGYYLNPSLYFSNPDVEDDIEITVGFDRCLQKMVPDVKMQDKIGDEIIVYRKGEGTFKSATAIRRRSTMPPVDWWMSYGASTPNLRKFAIRVLGLVCSSSGCERNWSFFEHIHSKKRNKLAQHRLNDLVYIKYNRALKRRYHSRGKVDPIILSDIDDANEWLTGEPENVTSDTSVVTDDILDDDFVGVDVGADEMDDSDYNLRSRLPNPSVVRPRHRMLVDEESDDDTTPMWDLYEQDAEGDNPEEDNLDDGV